jgi:hypothetical protein
MFWERGHSPYRYMHDSLTASFHSEIAYISNTAEAGSYFRMPLGRMETFWTAVFTIQGTSELTRDIYLRFVGI